MPERIILLSLYDQRPKSFENIVQLSKLSTVDCFKILQRLLVKGLVHYKESRYQMTEGRVEDIRSMLQQKNLKKLEAEQIVQSAIHADEASVKLKEVQCTSYDLSLLRNYFKEIEKLLDKISTRAIPANEKKYFFFWGEQTADNYINHLKQRYNS